MRFIYSDGVRMREKFAKMEVGRQASDAGTYDDDLHCGRGVM